MSFYNKSKKNTGKINKNLTLAQIIEEAATKPEYRALFYERMLKDYIYVLVEQGYTSSELTVGIDPHVPIIALDNGVIPVFTNPDRIYDSGAITQEMDYIKVRGRSFLELTIGNQIIVNPFSKYYKELIPIEISEMLNGSIFTPKHSPVIHTRMNALIGAPEQSPTALLSDLSNMFKSIIAITHAHIGWTFMDQIDTNAHYIIAIETEGELPFSQIAKLTSTICQQHLKADEVIDIVKLEKGGDFSEFFYNQSTPFYSKK
ncbi:enhanced serine sensitivity protein SseB C-terminal domain-containing protein [Myroides albus]|uniref:enhanced serine sensitivity protein SseB C-terminal domain-containing protein n=1 Tax=Myroides albus TaxID=2562892 RepID=UPI00215901E4|nr:enhanced serine sensitivity protein SseB C-terminal domain-containing protein [Myroides albus]UVD79303.1 enhanced serine sensitivity protein SseB C-terminal domain-containing protein [Myroides albus]